MANELQLNSQLTASMSTAVSMNNLIQVQKNFHEITVDAFIVAANADLLDRLQYHN